MQILQELHLQPPNTPNLDIAMSEMQFRPPDSVDALLNDIMQVTSCMNPLPSIDADILSSFCEIWHLVWFASHKLSLIPNMILCQI